jgi:hypothetical protein
VSPMMLQCTALLKPAWISGKTNVVDVYDDDLSIQKSIDLLSHNQKFPGQGIVKKTLFAGQKSWKTDVQPSSSWKLPRKLLVCILMIILPSFLQVKCPAVYFSDFLPAWCSSCTEYSLKYISIFLTPRNLVRGCFSLGTNSYCRKTNSCYMDIYSKLNI